MENEIIGIIENMSSFESNRYINQMRQKFEQQIMSEEQDECVKFENFITYANKSLSRRN